MNVAVSLVLANVFLLAPRIAALYKTPEVSSDYGPLQRYNHRLRSGLPAHDAFCSAISISNPFWSRRSFRKALPPSVSFWRYAVLVSWHSLVTGHATCNTYHHDLASKRLVPMAGMGPQVRRMFAFGGYSAMFNLLNTLGRRMDNVLIGWRFGHLELGPYAIAYRLFLTPISMITGPLGQS